MSDKRPTLHQDLHSTLDSVIVHVAALHLTVVDVGRLASCSTKLHESTRLAVAARPVTLSVILPVYNAFSVGLSIALRDILNQVQCPDYEVLACDDGSTDGGREWLVELANALGVRGSVQFAEDGTGKASEGTAAAAGAVGEGSVVVNPTSEAVVAITNGDDEHSLGGRQTDGGNSVPCASNRGHSIRAPGGEDNAAAAAAAASSTVGKAAAASAKVPVLSAKEVARWGNKRQQWQQQGAAVEEADKKSGSAMEMEKKKAGMVAEETTTLEAAAATTTRTTPAATTATTPAVATAALDGSSCCCWRLVVLSTVPGQRGQGQAMDMALGAAKGKMVALMESDDTRPPHALAALASRAVMLTTSSSSSSSASSPEKESVEIVVDAVCSEVELVTTAAGSITTTVALAHHHATSRDSSSSSSSSGNQGDESVGDQGGSISSSSSSSSSKDSKSSEWEGMGRYIGWQNSLHSPLELARSRFIEIPALHQTSLYKADLVRNLGGYGVNPEWPVDYDFWLRFFALGYTAVKLDARDDRPQQQALPCPSTPLIPCVTDGHERTTAAAVAAAALSSFSSSSSSPMTTSGGDSGGSGGGGRKQKGNEKEKKKGKRKGGSGNRDTRSSQGGGGGGGVGVVGPLYGWRQHSGQGTRHSGRCSIDNLRACKVYYLATEPLGPCHNRHVVVVSAGATLAAYTKDLKETGHCLSVQAVEWDTKHWPMASTASATTAAATQTLASEENLESAALSLSAAPPAAPLVAASPSVEEPPTRPGTSTTAPKDKESSKKNGSGGGGARGSRGRPTKGPPGCPPLEALPTHATITTTEVRGVAPRKEEERVVRLFVYGAEKARRRAKAAMQKRGDWDDADDWFAA